MLLWKRTFQITSLQPHTHLLLSQGGWGAWTSQKKQNWARRVQGKRTEARRTQDGQGVGPPFTSNPHLGLPRNAKRRAASPLLGPFPPAHTSHTRHTPLQGASRPQRPVPSLPLALWRQTASPVSTLTHSMGTAPESHPRRQPWGREREWLLAQPACWEPESYSQSESSQESTHWPNAAAQYHWIFQNGGLFCLGLWIQFILNLIYFLKHQNSDEPAARSVSSLTSHWPPKSVKSNTTLTTQQSSHRRTRHTMSCRFTFSTHFFSINFLTNSLVSQGFFLKWLIPSPWKHLFYPLKAVKEQEACGDAGSRDLSADLALPLLTPLPWTSVFSIIKWKSRNQCTHCFSVSTTSNGNSQRWASKAADSGSDAELQFFSLINIGHLFTLEGTKFT